MLQDEVIERLGRKLVEENTTLLLSAKTGLGRYPTREDHINRLRVLQYIENKEKTDNPDWSSNEIAKELKLKHDYVSSLFCWLCSNGDVAAFPG